MTIARPGPVSIATLRTQDLLESFADCLESLDDKEEYGQLVKEAHRASSLIELIMGGKELNLDVEENAGYLIEELFDALNNYAPEDHYFGGHPGNGAEFGFYPIDETEL